LRTWARRYGLGPSGHVAGEHRRYTAADTERLLIMRRLTLEGAAPAEAARIARNADVTLDDAPAPASAASPGVRGTDPGSGPQRTGAGQVVHGPDSWQQPSPAPVQRRGAAGPPVAATPGRPPPPARP